MIAEKEASWDIKEKLPIKVKVKKNGNRYDILVPPMKMTYKTWLYLDNHHRPEDIGVSYTSYDYNTGEAEYVANSKEDLDKWFKEYKKYVKPANKITEQVEETEQGEMNAEDLENCDQYPLPEWWDDDNVELVPIQKNENIKLTNLIKNFQKIK